MFSQPGQVNFTLPKWIDEYSDTYTPTTDLSERMRFVIEASKRNVEENTGGPFAAAIFESKTGCLVSLGVNLVTTQGMSILHAEIVAIAVAQRKLGTYDLGGVEMPTHELVTSTEPCAMCFGAVPWSGVRHIATAAFDEDARSIGFDEGPKPKDWIQELESRGIKVSNNIERKGAKEVLELYANSGGHIYNSKES